MREEIFLASKKRDDVIEDKPRVSEDDNMEVLEITTPSFSPLQDNANKA